MQNTLEYNITNSTKALARLGEALNYQPNNDNLKIDACVKRFEFNYESFRKTIEIALKNKEIDVSFHSNPKEALEKANQEGLINIDVWNSIIKDRRDSDKEYYLEISH